MDDGSTVINQLLEKYKLEGLNMPYTMEQFRKEYIKAHEEALREQVEFGCFRWRYGAIWKKDSESVAQ